jgi:MFS family permease
VFAYPAMAAPDRLRGRYNGAGTAAFGVGSAAGSIFGLAVYGQVGAAVWLYCALACVVGLVAAWFGMRTSVLAAAKASAATATATSAAEPAPAVAEPVPAAVAEPVPAGPEPAPVTGAATRASEDAPTS